jgi:glycogen debranching enzyme
MYDENGDYWRGGVWAPTNYMVLKGLEKNGYSDLAHEIGRNCLENVVAVFRKDGTIYENYAPEKQSKGNPAKSDFVGWSGLFPINILFENVFGICPNTQEEKIVWTVRLLEKHGVRNYPFGNLSVDLICEGRDGEDDEPIITAICEKPIQIEIRYGNKSKTICATERK